jgi:hypothetical protein
MYLVAVKCCIAKMQDGDTRSDDFGIGCGLSCALTILLSSWHLLSLKSQHHKLYERGIWKVRFIGTSALSLRILIDVAVTSLPWLCPSQSLNGQPFEKEETQSRSSGNYANS